MHHPVIILCLQAYCYNGQTLLASDKCGEAIRSLQEAEKCMYIKQFFNCTTANSSTGLLLHNKLLAGRDTDASCVFVFCSILGTSYHVMRNCGFFSLLRELTARISPDICVQVTPVPRRCVKSIVRPRAREPRPSLRSSSSFSS